jgi:manganese transport protein
MEKIDIVIAMNIAFVINAAMVVVSASVFFSRGMAVDSIELAHRSLEPLLGALSSGAFGIALLASGFSSSSVGAMAGETVMDGFVISSFFEPAKGHHDAARSDRYTCRRQSMSALVLSQVSLSFALPVAIIPMLLITSKKKYMGELANKKWVNIFGTVIVSLIILLNASLLYFTFSGNV